MKIANAKGLVTKLMITGLAAAAFVVASPSKAQAQGFAIGVHVGQPAYAPAYAYDRDGYRHDRDDFRRNEEFREREAREFREREAREAYIRHEQWEREHRFVRPYGYR